MGTRITTSVSPSAFGAHLGDRLAALEILGAIHRRLGLAVDGLAGELRVVELVKAIGPVERVARRRAHASAHRGDPAALSCMASRVKT